MDLLPLILQKKAAFSVKPATPFFLKCLTNHSRLVILGGDNNIFLKEANYGRILWKAFKDKPQ